MICTRVRLLLMNNTLDRIIIILNFVNGTNNSKIFSVYLFIQYFHRCPLDVVVEIAIAVQVARVRARL